jgi:hypothetical protein
LRIWFGLILIEERMKGRRVVGEMRMVEVEKEEFGIGGLREFRAT